MSELIGDALLPLIVTFRQNRFIEIVLGRAGLKIRYEIY
jgi:hypothetical protein